MSIRAKDIAKKLGVSTTTVSLVLNDKPGVGDKTRERVLKEIEAMGFETNIKLKPSVSLKSIRFILYKKHGLVVGDTPFFSKLIESIEGEAKKNGFNIIISYLNEEQNTQEYVKQFEQDDNTAGVMLLATEMTHEDVETFGKSYLPVLALDNCFDDVDIDCVQIDNVQGAYNAVNYLIKCGHKDIGYIHSSAYLHNFEQRFFGYKMALAENGIAYKEDKVILMEPTIEGSYEGMKTYLDEGNKPPAAIFSDNDILAMGASRALKEAGYKLPEDVSMVGLDDMPYCTMMRPQLTTVKVNNASMGIVAVRRLADMINGRTDETVKILIRTSLVVRKSVVEMKND